MSEILVEHLDDPRLVPYRDLKRNNLTRWSGQFIAEGIRVVERLLESGCEVESVLVTREQRRRFPEDLGSRVPVLTIPQSLAELLVGYRFHAGALACAKRLPNPSVEQMATGRRSGLLIACPRTTDPDNLGNIVRIAAAFGVDGLLIGAATADPFSRRTLRVSMGNALKLPIRTADNLADDLRRLRSEHGFQLLASCLDEAAVPIGKYSEGVLPTGPHSRRVLILGNEADGLEPEFLAIADARLMIPMAPGVDSLNVSVAAGILVHELTRGSTSAGASDLQNH